ncbi:MAG: hypothetical protein MUF39_12025, partial [Cyclobacteriaceae bacterium]|nr:hypothetical protein [Cyclobacteriaceae bacterium]
MSHVKVSEEIETKNIHTTVIEQFRSVVGSEFVVTEEEIRNEYGHDKTEDYQFLPDVVLKPGTPEEISAILKICNPHRIPVT